MIERELKKPSSSIELSQERLKELVNYDPETGLFHRRIRSNNRLAGVTAIHERPDGYFAICIDGKRYLAHRLAWLYVYGKLPTNQIDHINQIPGDNRIVNLRQATHAQNNMNRSAQINNLLGVKGVKSHGDKFVARLTHNKTTHYLGIYDTIEEAVNARRAAEKIYFGEFTDKT